MDTNVSVYMTGGGLEQEHGTKLWLSERHLRLECGTGHRLHLAMVGFQESTVGNGACEQSSDYGVVLVICWIIAWISWFDSSEASIDGPRHILYISQVLLPASSLRTPKKS